MVKSIRRKNQRKKLSERKRKASRRNKQAKQKGGMMRMLLGPSKEERERIKSEEERKRIEKEEEHKRIEKEKIKDMLHSLEYGPIPSYLARQLLNKFDEGKEDPSEWFYIYEVIDSDNFGLYKSYKRVFYKKNYDYKGVTEDTLLANLKNNDYLLGLKLTDLYEVQIPKNINFDKIEERAENFSNLNTSNRPKEIIYRKNV